MLSSFLNSTHSNVKSYFGVNFDSISVSLQTLDNIFAMRSLSSFYLTDTKPCLLNLQCSIHTVSKLRPKNVVIRGNVSRFDTPFSMLISSNLWDFSTRLFLNWSRLMWYRSPYCFVFLFLVWLFWYEFHRQFWYLIRGVSWTVSFLELLYSLSACS